MTKRKSSTPDFELIVGGPRESFRWNVHGYPYELAKWHYHPEYELHLIQESSGKMFIGDYVGDFRPGTLVLTGPNLPHNWVSDIAVGESIQDRDMLVQFSDSFMQDAMRLWPEFKEIDGLLSEAVFGIEFSGAAAKLGAELLGEIGKATAMRRVLLLFELLYELSCSSERKILSSRHYCPTLDQGTSETINKVLDFLTASIAEDIHLSDVANYFGMSESIFSRFFKRNTGHGFVHYLNRMRINLACDLLAQTDKPITSICFETGFNNISNFNRQFRKLCGLAPSEYRRQAGRNMQKSTDLYKCDLKPSESTVAVGQAA